MKVVRSWCSLLTMGLVLIACSRTTTSVDWERLREAGRLVERPAGLDVLTGKAQYRWTDGTVPLKLVPVHGLFGRGSRIAASLSGERGNRTMFLLDTGSVGSLLAMTAPLAGEVMLSRIAFTTIGTQAKGYVGYLPVVRMRGVEGRDMTVSLVTSSVLPDAERNLLGIVHLFHTQLEHRGGDWILRSGSARLAASERGWATVRLEPGTPVVRLRGPDGRVVNALIDTGAYESFVVGDSLLGAYSIRAVDGTQAHRFQVREKKDRRIDPRSFGGHEIGLVIGMDMLVSREWRLTFDESAWSFAPRR